MKKRILAVLLTGLMVFDVLSSGHVQAAVKKEENQVAEEVEFIDTETLEEFGQVVTEQMTEQECIQETDRLLEREEQAMISMTAMDAIETIQEDELSEPELSFETRTLIVKAEKEFHTFDASTIIKGTKDVSVLIYDSEKLAQTAYENLKAMEGQGIESVTVDTLTKVTELQSIGAKKITEEGIGQENEKLPEENVGQEPDPDENISKETKELPVENAGEELDPEESFGQETQDEEEAQLSELQEYIKQNKTDAEVKVAIIDTGIDLEDTILQGRFLDTKTNYSSSGEQLSIQDDNGHGTMMARIIAESGEENIKIMPIKAANSSGHATVLSTYLSLQTAMEQEADIILISMNGASGSAPILKEAIQEVSEKGTLVVVSAGNYGMDVSASAPADIEEALVIAATENGARAAYSNYGQTVDYCADGTYQESVGTSFAAARTAAMASQLATFLEGRGAIEEALNTYAQALGTENDRVYYGNGYLGVSFLENTGGIEQEKPEAGKEPEEEQGKPEEEKEPELEDKEPEKEPEPGNTTDGTDEGSLTVSYNKDENFARTEGGFNLTINGPLGQSKLRIIIKLPDTLYYTSKPISVSVAGNNIYGLYQREVTWTQEETPDSGKYRMIPIKFGFNYGLKAQNVSPQQGTYNPPVGDYIINDNKTIDLNLSTNNTGFTTWIIDDWQNPIMTYQDVNMWLGYTNFNINYNGNGGTGSISPHTTSYNDEFYISGNLFQKTGNTFKGYAVVRSSDNKVYCKNGLGWQPMSTYGNRPDLWNLYSPGGGNAINQYWINPDVAHKDDTFTFYAQWQPNTYKIRYSGNGATSGSMAEHSVTYGDAFNLKANGFAKTGHSFQGYAVIRSSDNKVYCKNGLGWQPMSTYGKRPELWNLYSPGGGNAINQYWINSGINGGDTFTFYAQWKKNNYTVTYSANGGKSVSQSSATVAYGDAINLGVTAVPKDSYYTFIGWGTSPNSKETLASLKMGAGNITLYALYSIPVSDVKQLYLQAWDKTNTSKTKLYPLTKTGTSRRGYTYKLNNTNYAAGFSNASNVLCRILACDNADNWSIIKTYDAIPSDPKPEVPVQYLQTVEHYRYDRTLNKYIKFATVNALKNKGETYTPQYITAPNGYQRKSIDAAYTVTGEKVSKAYYDNIAYTLYFNANGGTCSTSSKNVYFEEPYGELPKPIRTGYTFQGWYTASSGGTKKVESDLYQTKGNSTLYAQWKIDSHMVYYDYITNGGTSADKASASVSYGSAVDLKVGAAKDGWEFIGWNTDPNAHEAINSLKMGTEDIYLYAIFKKVLTATFIDESNTGKKERQESVTIFNRDISGTITIPVQNSWEGWEKTGWSLSTDAEALPDAAEGAEYQLKKDETFYGLYKKKITISYDTNGPGTELPEQSDDKKHNASGDTQNPTFELEEEPELPNNSFAGWEDEDGNIYQPGDIVSPDKDMEYTAKWDEYPEIEAYDRYFTLEQAQGGEITETELLEKVSAKDKEDGPLENGKDVIVKGYNPDEWKQFTEGGSSSTTYQATDSFGNQVEKVVQVHIVDTSAKEARNNAYIRYINPDYYHDDVSTEKGGLEITSIWRTNEVYKTALAYAMENTKKNTEKVKTGLFGKSYEIEKPGSGTWEHEKEVWEFSRDQIKEMEKFIEEKGYGRYLNPDASKEFYEKFAGCKKSD